MKPKAICLEDVRATSDDSRYLCCTVDIGHRPGLTVDNKGTTRWLVNDDVAFELFVTMDDRIGLLRAEGAVEVRVYRTGRHLDVEPDKPVILRHEDELSLADRHYLLHVHGETEEVYKPFFFKNEMAGISDTLKKTAAAVAIGATLGIAGCGGEKPGLSTKDDPIEVIPTPPAVAPPDTGVEPPDAGVDKKPDTAKPDDKIEVRTTPPKMAPPSKDE